MIMGFVTSRIGIAVIMLAVLTPLHFLDRHWAISEATRGFVLQVEKETVVAERDALIRRAIALGAANDSLRAAKQTAESELNALEKGIKDYEDKNPIDPDCAVTDGLLDGLR
jgi:uncharacterized protein YlxW (UPF0749 family)